MSGTSLDGIDVAFVAIEPRGGGYATRLLAATTTPFAPSLRERLRAALPPHAPAPREVAALDVALGEAFGGAIASLREAHPAAAPAFVASHGLTLFHDGDAGLTVQIGDPYRIRAAVGLTVVHDFRRADCALGGSGAPLVPFVDASLYAGRPEPIVALNVGGIANLTLLVPGDAGVRAWDTGPGNILLDAAVRARSRGASAFDRDGAAGARGCVGEAALAALAADDYFLRTPPKSTGRERFGEPFLARHAALLDPLGDDDLCATLTALTAETVARDVRAHAPRGATIVVSGGGARNPTLLAMLSARAPGFTVTTSEAYGIDADAKEAIAFAVLGYEALRGRPAGLPSVTGARAAAVLGAIVPQGLAALLARVAEETDHSGEAASNPAG